MELIDRVIYFTDICPFTSVDKETEVHKPLDFSSVKILEKEVLSLLTDEKIIRKIYITRRELSKALSDRWNIPIQQFENSYSINPFKEKVEIVYIKTNNIKKGQNSKEILMSFWQVDII